MYGKILNAAIMTLMLAVGYVAAEFPHLVTDACERYEVE